MRDLGALVRSMLALSRACAAGILRVASGVQIAEIAFSEGIPRAIALTPAQGETVGSLLGLAFSLDVVASDVVAGEGTGVANSGERAAHGKEPNDRIGAKLIAAGKTDAARLALALERQFRQRFRIVLRWNAPEIAFEERTPNVGIPWIPRAPNFADLVVDVLRTQEEDRFPMLGFIALTQTGWELLASATLNAEESRLFDALGSRNMAYLGELTARSRDARRLLQGLLDVGLCTREPAPDAILLARTVRAVRRDGNPEHLLRSAGIHSPRTLRRVAARLHPDHFERAPEPLRQASAAAFRAILALQENAK